MNPSLFVIYYQMQYNENNCEMENVFFFRRLGNSSLSL